MVSDIQAGDGKIANLFYSVEEKPVVAKLEEKLIGIFKYIRKETQTQKIWRNFSSAVYTAIWKIFGAKSFFYY